MKKYEILCVLPGTLAEGELSPIVTQIEEQLKLHGAEEVTKTDLGKSRLAYPIEHIRYGYFEFFTAQIAPEKVQVVERGIRLLGNILRVSVQVYNPKQKATITLAADPTALSAPQRNEDGTRPARTNERASVKKEADRATAPEEHKEAPVAPSLNLENIGEKLDEILQKDIDKV